jgi:hypothetical protein
MKNKHNCIIKKKGMLTMKQKHHNPKSIVVEKADIDEIMIPVVKWLNSYDEIKTISCCQGGKDKSGHISPHVMFTCNSLRSLWKILDMIYPFDNNYSYGLEISVQIYGQELRFAIKFDTQENLKEFIRFKLGLKIK